MCLQIMATDIFELQNTSLKIGDRLSGDQSEAFSNLRADRTLSEAPILASLKPVGTRVIYPVTQAQAWRREREQQWGPIFTAY